MSVATLGKAFGVNGGYVARAETAIPVVPMMLRHAAATAALVAHLRRHCILATGLTYPVVPKGEDEIRFQISADHTPADIDEALDALRGFRR